MTFFSDYLNTFEMHSWILTLQKTLGFYWFSSRFLYLSGPSESTKLSSQETNRDWSNRPRTCIGLHLVPCIYNIAFSIVLSMGILNAWTSGPLMHGSYSWDRFLLLSFLVQLQWDFFALFGIYFILPCLIVIPEKPVIF